VRFNVELDPTSAHTGDHVLVRASGYGANQQVDIGIWRPGSDVGGVIVSAAADDVGRVQTSFLMPDVTSLAGYNIGGVFFRGLCVSVTVVGSLGGGGAVVEHLDYYD
jgi:hypothetical protein